jgi:hypothetical protein
LPDRRYADSSGAEIKGHAGERKERVAARDATDDPDKDDVIAIERDCIELALQQIAHRYSRHASLKLLSWIYTPWRRRFCP